MDGHRRGHVTDSLNERVQVYEDLGTSVMRKINFKSKNLRWDENGTKVKNERQVNWDKPSLIAILSTCIIGPEIGKGHILQKVQVTTFHSKRKCLLILLAFQPSVGKVITGWLTFEQEWYIPFRSMCGLCFPTLGNLPRSIGYRANKCHNMSESLIPLTFLWLPCSRYESQPRKLLMCPLVWDCDIKALTDTWWVCEVPKDTCFI